MVVQPHIARQEPHCSQCGHGISVSSDLAVCPICDKAAPWVADIPGRSLAAGADWADADVHANERFDRKAIIEVGPLEAAFMARQAALRERASRETGASRS